MCIVIDANVFSSVFSRSSLDHGEFKPVLKWIIEGRGKIVYGGTKYISELRAAPKYLGIFNQLEMAGKVVKLCDSRVDDFQKLIDMKKDCKKCCKH